MRQFKGEVPPEAPLGGMPKPLFLLSSSAICDARYKWFQALGRYMDVPVWPLESPAPGIKEFFIEGAFERMVDMGVKHLRDFVSFVEQMARINGGRAFLSAPDRLGEYVLVDYITNKRKRVA